MAAAGAGADQPVLLLVILCNGMTGAELASTMEALRSSSKSIGTHKRRQLYWDAVSVRASLRFPFLLPCSSSSSSNPPPLLLFSIRFRFDRKQYTKMASKAPSIAGGSEKCHCFLTYKVQ